MGFLDKLKKQQKEYQERKRIEDIEIAEEEASESGSNIPSFSPFDFLDALTTKKIKWEDLGAKNQKAFNIFLMNKVVFSMVPDFVVFLTEIQMMQKSLSPEMFYKYLFHFLPQMNFRYKYLKKANHNISKDVIDILKLHFQESEKNVINYFKMLKPNELIEILKGYGWSEDKINKSLNLN